MSRYLSLFFILLLATDMKTVTDVRRTYEVDVVSERGGEGHPAVVTIGKGQYSEDEIARCFTNEGTRALAAGELVHVHRCFDADVRATF